MARTPLAAFFNRPIPFCGRLKHLLCAPFKSFLSLLELLERIFSSHLPFYRLVRPALPPCSHPAGQKGNRTPSFHLPEHEYGVPLNFHLTTGRNGLSGFLRERLIGIKYLDPPPTRVHSGYNERARLMVSIEQEIKPVVLDLFPSRSGIGNRLPIQINPKRLGEPSLPILVRHGLTVRLVPANVARRTTTMDHPSLKPLPLPEHRMVTPQADDPCGEIQKFTVGMLPVEPGNFVVLAIPVVVPP